MAAPSEVPAAAERSGPVAMVGLVAGPVLAGVIALAPRGAESTLSADGQTTAAVAVLMAVWWMTEAVPLPVTSLLPLVCFPLAGVRTFEEAAAPFASKYIFLFMGGFMIARAVEHWNLHRRIALLTVLAAGTGPARLIGGFMLATALLSMWISNTASTLMMLPIGMSLVTLVREHLEHEEGAGSNFATCMMLGIAYAASIGGLGTLVGTPTNLFLAGFLEDQPLSIGFGQWMLFATPFAALFLVIAWLLLTRWLFPIRIQEIPGGRALIRRELAEMGIVSRGEWTVLTVFVLTAAAWVLRQPITGAAWVETHLPAVARVNDTLIALVAALALFVIPVDAGKRVFALDWETARTLPWGVLLLFGGGFSLANAMQSSGLATWIGSHVEQLAELPVMLLVVIVVALVVLMTELTSNTPTAAAFLPVLFGVASGIGIDPYLFLVPATMAATCAFMLPVATPPNAIVFGSGHIRIRAMARAGVWLNLAAILLIPLWMYVAGRSLFVAPPG